MDCREGLKQLDNNSIDCCITSPPYWSLRDYGIEATIWDDDPECEHDFEINERKCDGGHSGGIETSGLFTKEQAIKRRDGTGSNKIIKEGFCSRCGAWKGSLGLEPNFELFIKHLCDIYDLIWKVLKPTGTCWVNLGDTYASNSVKSNWNTFDWNDGRPKNASKGWKDNVEKTTIEKKRDMKGISSKCLLMLPQRFAIEMVNRGWILRNVIIWHKPNAMPSSAKDRFTVDFEYVYFFVKSNKTQYWINEKTRKSMSTKPLGTKGIEGIDWEWRECEKCLGTGVKHKKCKFCGEIGWYYDELLRPRKCPKCRGLGRIRKDSECKSCKGKGIKKYNFWKGKQYFFEQQREGLSQNPATQERYKYKVGNQTNRKDNGVDKVKPGKAFSQHFPQNLPQENDFPLLKYNEEYLNLARLDKETRRKAKSNTNSKKHETGIFAGMSNESDQIYKDKVRAGILQGKNKRTVWKIPTKASPETHFATFPPDLVKPMIKSGCPKFVCKECGKPREKIIERIVGDQRPNIPDQKRVNAGVLKGGAKPTTSRPLKDIFAQALSTKMITTGYSDCGCNAVFEPGIVFDPFMGIGTTLLTAWNLGRNYIGFDISKEYCKIANKKLDITNYIRLDDFIEEKIVA